MCAGLPDRRLDAGEPRRRQRHLRQCPDRQVESVCPYCGVGCQLIFKMKDDRIVSVEGKDGPANHNRLCVKGRFGFDYVHHSDRLTEPLIRKDGGRKRMMSRSTGQPVHPF